MQVEITSDIARQIIEAKVPYMLCYLLIIVATIKIVKNPLSKEKRQFYDRNGRKVVVEKEYNGSTGFLRCIIDKFLK
jgi:hypothetical protein